MITVAGKTYAQILSGSVHWIFTSAELPEYNDATFEAVDITNVAPQPQSGWTASDSTGSWIFAPFVAPTPTVAQQAQAALSAGLSVVSTGTPALNGTYATDQLSQMDIIAIETSLNAGKGFPGGVTTFNYADTLGAFHAFTQSNFTDFAAAVRDYVYALKSVIAGSSSTPPNESSTIA